MVDSKPEGPFNARKSEIPPVPVPLWRLHVSLEHASNRPDSVGIDHIVDKLLVPNFTMREARAQFFGANRKEFLRVLYSGRGLEAVECPI